MDDFARAYCVLLLETHRFPEETLAFAMLGLARQGDACVFLAPGGCAVHAVKPLICSLAPFSRTHWYGEDTRRRFLGISKGFGRGPLWREQDVAASIQRETEQWDRHLPLFRSYPAPCWWEGYGLSLHLPLVTVEWTETHAQSWRATG